jgi:hypothetical protein
MRTLQRVISDIRSGENIDVYIAILLSFVVALLGLTGRVPLELVASAILLTLAVVLSSVLVSRNTLKELNNTIQELNASRSVDSYLKTRDEYAPLSETLANARTIHFMGSSLVSIFLGGYNQYLREEKLNKQSSSIQILLLDKQSTALDVVAECVALSRDRVLNDISASLDSIAHTFDEGITRGSLEVRLMPTYPGYNMTIVDPNEPYGKMFVEFIGYRSGARNRPHIELIRQRDGHWYEFFLQQYINLWDASKVYLTNRKET